MKTIKNILDLTLSDLESELLALGQKKYRAAQVFSWLHAKKAMDFAEMTDLPESLRATLSETFQITRLKTVAHLRSKLDETEKFLFECDDGNRLETVLMSYHYGDTICISTQIGCKMGCAFCASGKAGFVRDLTPGEMIAQINAAEFSSGRAVHNLVMMGIGEPLDNFSNVAAFLEIISDHRGRNMSMRHVSLSTSGLVDKIDLLAEKKLPLTLSVSLHATDDATRSAMMPVNKRYPISELLAACGRYLAATGRRISFEYALIDGVNDSEEHAKKLARLTKPYGGYINLIPVNDIPEKRYNKSGAVKAFQQTLMDSGATATIRRTLGADINAACGQLRRDSDISVTKL